MLKILFWLLVAINGALFALGQSLLAQHAAQHNEPQRLAQQLHPEQLVLTPPAVAATKAAVPAPAVAPPVDAAATTLTSASAPTTAATTPAIPLPAAPAAASVASAVANAPQAVAITSSAPVTPSASSAATPVPAPTLAAKPATAPPITLAAASTPPPSVAKTPAAALAPAPAPIQTPAPTSAAPLLACVEIGNFDPTEAKSFRARLAAAKLSARPAQRNVQEVASYMVFIGAEGDGRDGANRRAAELRRLGIIDFYIMPDTSPLHDAISLGLFKTEAAAKAYVGQLISQGVRSARITERTASTNKVAFRLRDLTAADQAGFATLAAAFPSQSRHDCND